MSADHETCSIHPHVTLTKFCAACRGSKGGGKASAAQVEAAQRNGKKGGYPKGRPRKPRP